MNPLRHASALCLVSALALAGCESSRSTEIDFEGSRTGTASFTYAGALSGTYSASGKYELDRAGNALRVPFAVGLRYFEAVEGEDFVNVVSFNPRSDGFGDAIDLYLEDEVAAGQTISFDLGTCLASNRTLNERCGFGYMAFDVDPDDLGDQDVWQIDGGTMQIESVTRYNLRARFNVTLRNPVLPGQITATNGVIDLPVINESDAGRFSVSPARLLSRGPRAR